MARFRAESGHLIRHDQEDSYQRRVQVLTGDETLADVYLGTSPGYRRVHARRADADDVYSIEFSNFEAGTDVSSWLKKSP